MKYIEKKKNKDDIKNLYNYFLGKERFINLYVSEIFGYKEEKHVKQKKEIQYF
jgi:hypothetical protein